MGSSAWLPGPIYAPPLPLLLDNAIVEQPVDLNKLSEAYVAFATSFIHNQSNKGRGQLFLLL